MVTGTYVKITELPAANTQANSIGWFSIQIEETQFPR